MKRTIRIGTRGSALALWQANETQRLLKLAGYDSEIIKIRTTGDKRQNVKLAFGLADDVHVRLVVDEHPQSVAQHGVVIDEEHVDLHRTGTRT